MFQLLVWVQMNKCSVCFVDLMNEHCLFCLSWQLTASRGVVPCLPVGSSPVSWCWCFFLHASLLVGVQCYRWFVYRIIPFLFFFKELFSWPVTAFQNLVSTLNTIQLLQEKLPVSGHNVLFSILHVWFVFQFFQILKNFSGVICLKNSPAFKLWRCDALSISAEEGADRCQPNFPQEETDRLVRQVQDHNHNWLITSLMKSDVLVKSLMLWC